MNQQYKLILASQSPRRRQLLQEAGYAFDIITADMEETYPAGLSVLEIPTYIAQQKVLTIQERRKFGRNIVIIAADTIVALNETIFGKPKDAEEAFQIIRQLSGKQHQVVTGIYIWSASLVKQFSVSTKVFFNELTDNQIHYYIKKYQPFDKAGAYAIQEWIGMIGVDKIEGCYFNVMGLPVSRLCRELQAFEK